MKKLNRSFLDSSAVSALTFNDSSEYETIFRNDGLVASEGKYATMQDALSHPDAPVFFQQTIENYVREAIEPRLILSSLLQTINYKAGTTISFGSIGAMVAADIPEGGEYPERSLTGGQGVVTATIGKSGIAFKITEEMKRYSQYDVVGLYMRAASRALARHKERKAANMMLNMGVVAFDNLNPSASVYGSTSGRKYDGAGNGVCTADDLWKAYGQVLLNGFQADAIIVHPLTYIMWMSDPLLRAFALETGKGGQWFNGWVPGTLNEYQWAPGATGKLGPANNGKVVPPGTPGATGVNEYSNQQTIAPKMPDYFGLPLRVIVSNDVPYNPVTMVTDIIVADSGNIGAMIVDENVTMDEVPDKLRDITKVKLRERYALASFHEGNAIATIKNVVAKPNELNLPIKAVMNVDPASLK